PPSQVPMKGRTLKRIRRACEAGQLPRRLSVHKRRPRGSEINLRYVVPMSGSIPKLGILVACLCGAAALAGAAGGKPAVRVKKTQAQKDAEAFLTTTTGLLAPVSAATAGADWRAATD